MRKRRGADERLTECCRAVQAIARGQFQPRLPASLKGGSRDGIERLGRALSNLGAALERRFTEADALLHLSEMVNAGLLPEEVLDQTFKSFRSIIPYDRIGCSVIEDDGRRVRAVWARADAPTSSLDVGYSAPLAGSSLAKVLATCRPRIINDLEQYLREHPDSGSTRLILADGVRSSLTCPLVARGRPIGFVFFSSNRPGTYSRRHVELFTRIAGQLALVIEKGRLYADLLQAKKGLEAANKKLSQMATLDGLTGVPNRRTMDEMLKLAWRRAARNRTPLSLILMDIDHFKDFNDRFGHVAGDHCLIQVAKEMRGALKRPDDFIARYGGEEFLAFPSQTPVDAAAGLAERLRLQVAQLPIRIPASGELARVTVSAGVAGINAVSSGSVTHLIASADRALYSAKTAGRNRVARADSLQPVW